MQQRCRTGSIDLWDSNNTIGYRSRNMVWSARVDDQLPLLSNEHRRSNLTRLLRPYVDSEHSRLYGK